MNVILCGFHWTGCSALQQLLNEGHNVFVYTHESPYHVPSVIEHCQRTGTPFTTDDISRSELPFRPDVIASIYYRFIIKPKVIDACGGRIFNLHPSLLPMYRGCSSLTWAMVNGEKETGFTYHYIDQGCDTGNILLQQRLPIEPWDTQATLYGRVQYEAMKKFKAVLALVRDGDLGYEQTGMSSSYRRGCPYDGQIDPTWSREQTERFIRAMINPPYPPAKLGEQEIYGMKDLAMASSRS